MEKDLKEKKPSENNDPKIPWPKLIPAAAVIAALAFSGIKAQGSDENTETLQKSDTTVMSASELEKYLGYEEEDNSVSEQIRKAYPIKVLQKRLQKNLQKKQLQKRAPEKELYLNLQKAMSAQQDRVPLRHQWPMFRQAAIKTEHTKDPEPDSAVRSLYA